MSGVLSEYRRRCVCKGDTPSLNLTKFFLKTAPFFNSKQINCKRMTLKKKRNRRQDGPLKPWHCTSLEDSSQLIAV